MKRVILAALLCNGCLLSGKGGGENSATSSASAAPYYRYAVLGDSASEGRTFITILNLYKSWYCLGDSVEEFPRTPTDQEYRLSGDSLEFWFFPTGDNTDTSLQVMDRYVRNASGAGLLGEWKRTGTVPRVATAPASETMRRNQELWDSAFLTERMVITKDSMFLYYDRTANTTIWDLVLNHSQGMGTEFRGRDTVVFTRTDGWRVTVSEDDASDIRFVSSRPQDPEYVRYAMPKHCPDDAGTPDWYSAFYGIGSDPQPAAKLAAPIRDRARQR